MARKRLEYPGTIQDDTRGLCPWNDHGLICGKRGSLSDGLLGGGSWYCPEHYWLLKGQRVPDDGRIAGPGPFPCNYPGCTSEGIAGKNPFYCLAHYGHKSTPSYRADWYAERGLTYQPPKTGNATDHLPRKFGPRQRIPGDDDDTPVTWE